MLTRRQILAAAAWQRLTAQPPPIRTGPEKGQPIPEFSLPDQFGNLRNLGNLRGSKGLVLAFVRSADW